MANSRGAEDIRHFKFTDRSEPSRTLPISLRRDSVTQDLARSCAGEAVALPGNLAVHDHLTIALGALHAAPFVARQVVRNLDRQHLQPLEVVNHDIGRCALAQEATILESGAEGRKPRHAPVDLFEAQPLLLANKADEAFGGIASSGKELR